MKRLIFAATFVLIIQLGLTVAVHLNRQPSGIATPESTLFLFSPADIDRVTIYGAGDTRLQLQLTEGGWILPEVFSVAAGEERVAALLDKVSSLHQGFAVATTPEAAKRFKVSEEGFERRLLLQQGETVFADLYIGGSPGLRQVYARKAGQDEILTVKLATYEMEPTADKWIDNSLIQPGIETINKVVLADYTLSRENDTWQFDRLGVGEHINSSQVQSLLNKINSLTINGVIGPGEGRGLLVEEPIVKYTVVAPDGITTDFSLVKSEGEDVILKMSTSELSFKISSWAVDEISKITREQLVESPEAEAGGKPAEVIDEGN